MRELKVLFVAANPEQTTKLKLDEEVRAITQKIRASDYRDSLELITVWAVRPDDLLQYLNEHRPQVVHFSGHGNVSGNIVLVDDLGAPKPVSPTAIRSLFSTLKDNIQLVILNACYTKPLAEAITETIGCTIGMNTSIGDDAAIVFAASFYRAIGFGRSVQEAFEQGKTALLLAGIPEDQTPELMSRKEGDWVDRVYPENIYLLTLPAGDVGLLERHRVVFDRAAFRTPCISELDLGELIEAIDDTQAALNTGTLYSRSGKLLTTFPTKSDYQSDECRDTFEFIANELSHLKRLAVFLDEALVGERPQQSTRWFVDVMVVEASKVADASTIRSFIHQMDEIDESRNQVIRRLNVLLRKYNLKPFSCMEISSQYIRRGGYVWRQTDLTKYLWSLHDLTGRG